jgi:tRNA (guanine-N7-)-methyltransferase
LKEGGIIYTITDVEDLHNWHLKTIDSFPCFERISSDELKSDKFLGFMKNTDEARKVARNNGSINFMAWRRVKPKINTFSCLMKNLVKHNKVNINDDQE